MAVIINFVIFYLWQAGFSLFLQIQIELVQTHILCFVAAPSMSLVFCQCPWPRPVVVAMSGSFLHPTKSVAEFRGALLPILFNLTLTSVQVCDVY